MSSRPKKFDPGAGRKCTAQDLQCAGTAAADPHIAPREPAPPPGDPGCSTSSLPVAAAGVQRKPVAVRQYTATTGAGRLQGQVASLSERVTCRFAPQCSKTFCNNGGMLRHCSTAHREAKNRPFKCDQCKDLRFFETKKQIGAHIRNVHSEYICICGSKMSPGNKSRHQKICTMVIEATCSRSSPEFAPTKLAHTSSKHSLEPTMSSKTQMPPTPGLRRSAHRAPKHEDTIKVLPQFWSFLRGDTVLFRQGASSARAHDKMCKFRTFIGKFAKFHGVDTAVMLADLADKKACTRRFEMKKLTEFCVTLDTSDNGDKLAASTKYNIISALGDFLTWQTSTNRVKRLLEAKTAIADLISRLSPKRKRDADPEAQAARIDKLPKVPEVLQFLHTELKERVEAVDASTDSAWRVYKSYFNFVIVMLLFAIPPQRASIYRRLKTKHISDKDGILVMTVAKHKTSSIYGPLVIAIPASYRKEFDGFLEARSRLVGETGSSDGALFLKEDGSRDKQLTRSFSVVIHCGFKKRVSMRDCRRIYITHAYDTEEFTQDAMVKLARQMYHSFDMQQRTYVSKTSVDTAITSLDSVQCLNPYISGNLSSKRKRANQREDSLLEDLSSSDGEGTDSNSSSSEE